MHGDEVMAIICHKEIPLNLIIKCGICKRSSCKQSFLTHYYHFLIVIIEDVISIWVHIFCPS